MSHIALCEDDTYLRTVETEVLSTLAGHQVDSFETSEALIAALPRIQPSLIILDVMLPRMSGIHAYECIRTLDAYHDVPVLFYTASPERVQSARLTGNYAIASKPMDIDSLLMLIAHLLRRDPGLHN